MSLIVQLYIIQLRFLFTFVMSCPATNIAGFNKSKEDFIWFIKKATNNKKSDAHAELYHCLLKMFVDADTNKDGLVSKASFSNLIDMAASIPRMYGYAPVDSELYKTEQEKEQARKKMFDSMDLKSTGVITFDEWYKFSMEHIVSKTATLDPHPILDHGNIEQFKTFLKAALTIGSTENTELYWFLLELFTEHDTNKNGIVTMSDFPAMLDMVLKTPKKLAMVHPDKVGVFFNKL
jgi:Ca2+-binding EF-hand superfamily protein